MISFAQPTSADAHPRAIKAAILSTIPGLGQLFNRRLDKAIAFFLVDLVNLAFISILMGARIPLEGVSIDQWVQHMYAWRPGTAPFFLVELMLLSYVVYAQYDAYRDAIGTIQLGRKPDLSLSHTTCASYILHLTTIFAICLFILVKITPDYHPEQTQISLSFELSTPEPEKQLGQDAPLPEDSFEKSAHLKERSHDALSAASASAELSNNDQSQDAKPDADETEAVASKQIITPDAKQSPQEVSSKGASEKAKETTKEASEETKVEKSSPNESAKKVEITDVEQPKNNDAELAERAKPRLIAQLPDSAAAASGVSKKVDPSNSDEAKTGGANAAAASAAVASAATGVIESSISIKEPPQVAVNRVVITGVNTSGALRIKNNPASAAFVAFPDSVQAGNISNQPVAGLQSVDLSIASAARQPVGFISGAQPNRGQTGPAMLGFIDSSLSNDPDMRQYWSEMSSGISRWVKQNPLQGQGTAVVSFALDKNGRPVDMKSLPATALASSLSGALSSMPALPPPAGRSQQMFFQAKASNDGASTFISLELNSQPSQLSKESLSDFKYQVNLQAYLKGIKKAIYSSWKPPVQEGVKPVMVGFKINTDGRVSNQHVVQSSGDPKMDQAALQAALSVTKWSQPPAGTEEDLDVCMVIQKCKNCEGEAARAEHPVLTY